MGNIPLAALLYSNGVAFAGIMAFIFSDLVVFPVLRINAKYYGWKMALYILAALLVALVASALLLHYGFALTGLLPGGGASQSITDQEHFQIDYTFFLNLAFLAASGALAWLAFGKRTQQEPAMAGHGEGHHGGHAHHGTSGSQSGGEERDHRDHGGGGHDHGGDKGIIEQVLFWLALASYVWLAGGLIAYFVTGGA